MIIFKKADDIAVYLERLRQQGRRISFVPTMGALHQGHISLVRASKKNNNLPVCSIFVNPAQFNDSADFDKYPSAIEKDINLLEKNGCAVLFLPSVSEMYPENNGNKERFALGYLENVLEGRYRPGHFQGVCLVVNRLLNIIKPEDMYLGQKDYQQCMVIKKLTALKGIKTTIEICPTLRESNGLAMSSRNLRLSEASRNKASVLFETLSFVKHNLKPGSLTALKQTAIQKMASAGFAVDYLEIATASNLNILDDWDGTTTTVALAAASIEEVRLIDNLLL